MFAPATRCFRAHSRHIHTIPTQFQTPKSSQKWLLKTITAAATLSITVSYLTQDSTIEKCKNFLVKGQVISTAHAFSLPDHGLHPTHYPWNHKGLMSTYDHNSMRRGYQVYKEVCSACHSMDLVHYRELIGVTHSEEEVKEMAAEYEYLDGPNDEGEMFMRPGKPTDSLPRPYANEQLARAANGGALPPDLSCIARARHGEEDYIFSLMTGYHEPPEGLSIRDGMHYNPYFPGGAISMARPIYDEQVEYEDGTDNNASQISKDVATFLAWASYPEHDERKKMGWKAIGFFTLLLGVSIWHKRFKWSYIKSKRIVFKPTAKRDV